MAVRLPLKVTVFLAGTPSGLQAYPALPLCQHTPVPGQACPLLFLIPCGPRLFCLSSPGPEGEGRAVPLREAEARVRRR